MFRMLFFKFGLALGLLGDLRVELGLVLGGDGAIAGVGLGVKLGLDGTADIILLTGSPTEPIAYDLYRYK